MLERRRGLVVEHAALLPRISGEDGCLAVRTRLRAIEGTAPPSAVELELAGPSGTCSAPLALVNRDGCVEAHGELRVPAVARWWPHTHGEPTLYRARLIVNAEGDQNAGVPATAIELPRVGFRTLAAGSSPDHDPEQDGLDLHVNGVSVFARGAVWTPVDAVGLAPTRAALRAALEQARAAGMNILRIPGTSAYETADFHDLCDELGMLVWQDFMFANLDYPISDEAFHASVDARGRAGARASVRTPEPRRAVRQQRDRAAGGDARPRPVARSR